MANEEKKDDELEGTEESPAVEPEEATDEVKDAEEEALETEADDSDDSDEDEGFEDEDESDEDDFEEESDDEDQSEDETPAATASSATRRRKKKTGRKKRKPATTAGQRLAAAKAAKAARKAAARGKDAEQVEDKATEQAEAATRWLEANRKKLGMALAAILLIAVGVFAISRFSRAGDAEAAAALWEAYEVANAPIVDPEDEVEIDEDAQTFESEAARAEAAVTAFDAVVADHGGTEVAAYAQVGRGNALRALGKPGEAKGAYQAALDASDDPEVTLRALEGLGFAAEAEEALDDAEARFEEMGDIERPGARILADYHLARLALAQNEREAAKEKLQAVLESLDEEDSPQMVFVRDQAELRLREIDPSLVQSSAPAVMPGMGGMPGGAGGGLGDQMTPEMQRILQELMQKQQQQQGQ